MLKLFSVSVTLAMICNVAVYHSYKGKGGICDSYTKLACLRIHVLWGQGDP